MESAALIVVADRGMLKAYEVRHTKHGPSPRLIAETTLKSAHEGGNQSSDFRTDPGGSATDPGRERETGPNENPGRGVNRAFPELEVGRGARRGVAFRFA
jgi:hypothetical protein